MRSLMRRHLENPESTSMKVFHCDHCNRVVFFENVQCVGCKRKLAYAPDLSDICSFDQVDEIRWKSPSALANGKLYRHCTNYARENVCNWAIPDDDPNTLCAACRLNLIIPDLSIAGHRELWRRLEAAKRRLVCTLLKLHLPLKNRIEDPQCGLGFQFMADTPENKIIFTGHSQGIITINVAEADDVEREKRRVSLGEPFRTLLGHFRHESGHYYWERLVKDSNRLEEWRRLFGNEQEDYGKSIQNHYSRVPSSDWPERFVSVYASAHPWEDWAETWAHYLHMVDTLEMAAACGLCLQPGRSDEPSLKPLAEDITNRAATFDLLIDNWLAVTYVLNNLNRALGQRDGYPFVLSTMVIEKLRFVDETVRQFTPPNSKEKKRQKTGTKLHSSR